MISIEIQNAEVITWWETEREYVRTECERQFHRLSEMANEVIDKLSVTDAIWLRSDARDDLKRQIRSEVEMHNRRLAKHLAASYELSTSKIEALSELDGASTTEYATVAASVAAGAGAVGLTLGAGAFVPAISSLLSIPVAGLASWPIVATLGAGAIGAAWISPKFGTFAIDKVRDRYKRAVQSVLRKELICADGSAPNSSWNNFSNQLYNIAQSRLRE